MYMCLYFKHTCMMNICVFLSLFSLKKIFLLLLYYKIKEKIKHPKKKNINKLTLQRTPFIRFIFYNLSYSYTIKTINICPPFAEDTHIYFESLTHTSSYRKNIHTYSTFLLILSYFFFFFNLCVYESFWL